MGGYSFGAGMPTYNGMPMLGGNDVELTGGKVFWVDSGLAGNNPTGLSPTRPLATINAALALTSANRCDIIFCMPGHTETIAAAGGVFASTNGVRIIGLGIGSLRPTLNFSTASTATFSVSADNVKLKNFYMDMTKVNAIPYGLSINGNGFWMDNCEIYFAKTSYVATCVVSTLSSTLTRLKLTNNYIHGDAVASCTNAIQDLGGDSHVYQGNTIVGNFTTTLGCINNVTPGPLTNVQIDNNWLANRTAAAQKVIVLYSGDTGFITNNRMANASATSPITAAGTWVGGNYWQSAAATSATLL